MLLLVKIKRLIKKKHKNDKHRYIHSLGVAKMSKYLAKIFIEFLCVFYTYPTTHIPQQIFSLTHIFCVSFCNWAWYNTIVPVNTGNGIDQRSDGSIYIDKGVL